MNSEPRRKTLCPWCADEGERSTIAVYGWFVTAMFEHDYFDEEGNFHHHNPNGVGTTYECSRGHQWKPSYNSCGSCDEYARPARLIGRLCPYSATPMAEERGWHACPECGQRVATSAVMRQVDGEWVREDIKIERHLRRVDEPEPRVEIQEARSQ